MGLLRASCLLVVLQATSIVAFTSIPFILRCQNCGGLGRLRKGQLSLTCQLDRIEAKAIEKFTTQYEKLCKTCPSRLQPRVDTLVQMINGLPPMERAELFSRLGAQGVQLDVSQNSFTTAPTIESKTEFTPKLRPMDNMKPEEDEIAKKKCKMAKNGRKLAVVRQLLAVIESCSEPDFNSAPAMAALAEEIPLEYVMEAQAKFAEDLTELQQMTPACRLTRKMKLLEKQAKYERKKVEYAMEIAEMEAMAGRECVAA